EAYNTLRECTLDKGAGGRGWGQIGADEGEAPDRRRIPDVLHRRVIVERQTPQQVVTLDLGRMGKSNIGIVHSEPAVDPAVSTLDESSDIIGNSTAGKKTDLLHRKIIVRPEMRSSAARLANFGSGKCRLQHDRNGQRRVA